jgi:protein ImuB
MRYAEALSIVCDLRAVTVSDQDREAARQEIRQVLVRWSPRIEDCPVDPGSFWLGAGGLSRLFGTEAEWGASLRKALGALRWQAVVVVGWTREGTFLLARHRRRSTVVRSPGAEARALGAVPLTVLPLTPRARRLLGRLGFSTWAGLSQASPGALARRFGPDLLAEVRKLQSLAVVPVQTEEPVPGVFRSRKLDFPVTDHQALADLLAAPLTEALGTLGRRGRLAAELRLAFSLETGDVVAEVLRPASPTADPKTLLRLAGLRLAQTVFGAGVVEIRLVLEDVPLPPGSGDLFAPPVVRDPVRGAEALALVRAQCGNASVVRAVLADSHVPGLSYRWEPTDRPGVPAPRPPVVPLLTAVRRVPLGPPADRGAPAGRRLGGPFRLQSGAAGDRIDREYWFLAGARGEVQWVYWDRLSRKAGWEGVVD